MAPEPIKTAYFINPSQQSVRMSIPPVIARQILGKHVPLARNTGTMEELLDMCICGSFCVSPYRRSVTTQ
jgi:hypothetical protein